MRLGEPASKALFVGKEIADAMDGERRDDQFQIRCVAGESPRETS